MKDLAELFKSRDKAEEDATGVIFESIHVTLQAVSSFLSDVDDSIADGILIWQDAEYLDKLVTIIGMISYEIGTTMQTEEGMVEITANNIEYFQRMIHMSLPLDLVSSNDYDKVIHFLQKMQDEDDIIEYSEPLDIPPNEYRDFDLSKLTDDQRRSLIRVNSETRN